MSTTKINHLGVIEIPYGDLNWGPDPKHIRKGIYSDIQHWKKYRELDDYKLCGIYNKATVPYTVEEIVYQPKENEEVYLTLTRQVSDAVYQHLSNKEALLLTGGYCKDAVGVCGGIQRAIGSDKRVGIIYLDAHSDMSTPAVTHTGILGGMDMAVILGVDMEEWRTAAGLAIPYDDRLVILSDFREAEIDDDGALAIIEKLHINWLKSEEFENANIWRENVEKLASQVDAIYLHIDADILNNRHVPNAACVAEGGPSIDTVMRNIRIVMQTGKVLVYGTYGFYFDTDIPGQDSLTLSGLRVVSSGLEEWKEYPELL
ncbi:arginase family protein [Parablautia sp. Marseille-Q6255]|uniref:arginase family protein n=1 Tax=Parablautia sp. Marseille-Q6255 TaxID=3039593 RepID=UPI0024BCA506|nr:arginase family protein [Parablautia sp. Marseille-Q6255]